MVHFSIVIVSVILLIVAVRSKSDEGIREDLDAVMNIVHALRPENDKSYGTNPGILERMMRNHFSERISEETLKQYTIRIHEPSINLNTIGPFNINVPMGIVFHGQSVSVDDNGYVISVPYSDFFSDRTISLLNNESLYRYKLEYLAYGKAKGVWEKFNVLSNEINRFKDFWNELAMTRHAYVLEYVGAPAVALMCNES